MTKFETKDSGKRYVEESGFQRDIQDDKPRFDLMFAKDVPYSDQMITRFAELLSRGAKKYNDRNWERADSDEAMDRAKSSMLRHCIQAVCDEQDEDHLAAVMFNVLFISTLQHKLKTK